MEPADSGRSNAVVVHPMDIGRWVQGVIAAETPGLADRPKVPDIFQPKHSICDALVAPRKRKRSSADTSFLELAVAPPHAAKSGRGSQPDSRTPSISALSSSSGTGSPEIRSESSSGRYKRKPRRKTRPDRYDLKENGKKRRSDRSTAKKKEKKSTRHNRERKGKRNRRSDLALNDKFSARNVSKDRLTLRPGANLGVFGNAKTSASSRRQELPDLAFSNMKFLREQRDSVDDRPRMEHPSTRRKKVKAKLAEEEISTFFVPERPALKEVSQTSRVRNAEAAVPQTQQAKLHFTRIGSTTEVSEHPPAETDSLEPRHSSTPSYFSWSTTVRESRNAFGTSEDSRSIRARRDGVGPIPFRSSSAGELLKPFDFDIQHGQTQKRTRSDVGSYSARNLPGESGSLASRGASLLIATPQHDDKRLLASTGHTDSILGLRSDLPISSSKYPPVHFAEQQAQHRNAKAKEKVNPTPRHGQPHEALSDARSEGVPHVISSSSIYKLLRECNAANTRAVAANQTVGLGVPSQVHIDARGRCLPDLYPELHNPVDHVLSQECSVRQLYPDSVASGVSSGSAQGEDLLDVAYEDYIEWDQVCSEGTDSCLDSTPEPCCHVRVAERNVGDGLHDLRGDEQEEVRLHLFTRARHEAGVWRARETSQARQDAPLSRFWRPNRLY